MPVLRDYIMGDGSTKNVVDQDYERRYRDMLLSTDNIHPSYKQDPTYDLKRQRRRL
jgi:hypothetical protein